MTTGRLILAGVAVQYVLSALTSLVLVLAAHPDQMRSVLFWTLGGLGGARWDELALPAVALLLGTGLLIALARPWTCCSPGRRARGRSVWTPDGSGPPSSSSPPSSSGCSLPTAGRSVSSG
ncbi:hypothetical protein GCM10020254_13010 [Streptomyces goshikiensis]